MAEILKGANGAFSGKVGSVIGSNWRDINYIRGIAKRSKKDPTLGQLAVRLKFGMMADLLLQAKTVVDRGFSNQYTGRATAFNLALQANIHAFKGVYPDLEIDYPALRFSNGRLKPAMDARSRSDGPGMLSISWEYVAQATEQAAADKPTIVLVCPEKNMCLSFDADAERADKKAELQIPQAFSGTVLHGYIFFTSHEGTNSDSVYIPNISVM